MKQIRVRMCPWLCCLTILTLLSATPALAMDRPEMLILIVTDDQGTATCRVTGVLRHF